jgi:hypothetical protein
MDKGLCKLVAPSIVATALNASMTYPTTLTQRSTTVCAYRAKTDSSSGVIIRFDTHVTDSTYSKTKATFRRRGQKLATVTGLGDEGYYFSQTSSEATVTTVVIRSGSLQLLVTGTSTLNPLGSIAQYALTQFTAQHASGTTTTTT